MSATLRLFAALSIRPDISAQLLSLQTNVPGAIWCTEVQLHLTLAHFGRVDSDIAADLDIKLADLRARQMKMSVKGTGWFGRKEPRSLWAGVAASAELQHLSSACIQAARRLSIPMVRQRFRPHITLAYCHQTSLGDAEAFTAAHSRFSTSEFWVDRFHLYSSHLGKGSSQYRIEADYPLY